MYDDHVSVAILAQAIKTAQVISAFFGVPPHISNHLPVSNMANFPNSDSPFSTPPYGKPGHFTV